MEEQTIKEEGNEEVRHKSKRMKPGEAVFF
jgi:hypothetical protein